MIIVLCTLIIFLFGGYFDSPNGWLNSGAKL